MDNKKVKNKEIDKTSRIYSQPVVSAISHPTRQKILKKLLIAKDNEHKSGLTTKEFEIDPNINESRYNLYHHLGVLEKAGIVESIVEGRSKFFSLTENSDIQLFFSKKPLHPKKKFRWQDSLRILLSESNYMKFDIEKIEEVILIISQINK